MTLMPLARRPIDGLQIFVVEGLSEQDRGDPFDERGVADGAVGLFVVRDASVVSFSSSPPRPRMRWANGLAKQSHIPPGCGP